MKAYEILVVTKIVTLRESTFWLLDMDSIPLLFHIGIMEAHTNSTNSVTYFGQKRWLRYFPRMRKF